jgi:S-DNA-T family DNA segregation ATPase FtsK/SpoIIIE
VACTQKPTTAIIGSLVKSNFPVRLVGSVTSPEDAKVASGISQTGADRLLGRGDFILVAKGQVMRLQGAYIARDEIAALVRRSAQRTEPIRLLAAADDKGWMPRLVQKVANGFTRA